MLVELLGLLPVELLELSDPVLVDSLLAAPLSPDVLGLLEPWSFL